MPYVAVVICVFAYILLTCGFAVILLKAVSNRELTDEEEAELVQAILACHSEINGV